MKTFENWYTSILEEVATQPAKTLVGDVDTIISSLDTLVKELTEELDSPEFNEVNEADAEGPGVVMQWIWWMPKARKAQQKVNKIKLNVTDMEAAASDAPDKEQKAKISAKATIARDQADQLQKMVDDKYGAKGSLVQKALSSEKIAGQIASIKRATGLEDDPEKIASYKEKMAELQGKYKEDQEAIKELEPSDADKEAEIAKKKAEQKKKDDKKIAQDKLNADAEAAKKGKKDDTEGTDDTTTPAKDDTTTPAKDDTTTPAKDDTTTPAKDDTTTPTKDDTTTDTKDKQLSDLKNELEAVKKDGDEKKIAAVQAKIDALEAKESWQIEGTHLGKMYEMEINKLKFDRILNESRYQNLSIKDRFSKLL